MHGGKHTCVCVQAHDHNTVVGQNLVKVCVLVVVGHAGLS